MAFTGLTLGPPWFSLFLFIIGIVVGVTLGVTSASQAMQYVFDVLVFVAVLLVFACQPGTPGPNKSG
jgi:uncharacterized membrane protein YhaH (DUF805 family)